MTIKNDTSSKLAEIGRIVSQESTKIGEGFTATVHLDPNNPEICYKVLKHVPQNGFMSAKGQTGIATKK